MDIFTILLFISLLFFSAFFSSSEIAIMSLPVHAVDALVKKKRIWSRILQTLKNNTDTLLITILIGSNLLNTLTASLATKIAIDMARSSNIEEGLAIGISTGIITFFILTFTDIIPKSLWAKHASTIALLCAYPLKALSVILAPVVYIFQYITEVFTGKQHIARMTNEEVESFIDLGKDNWALDVGEHKRIKWILELWDITAEDIMTPRVNIVALNIHTTVWDALAFFLNHNHSRIPVYHETIDKISGFITLRDLVVMNWADAQNITLANISIHQVLKIPLNQPIDTLFELFQKNQKHIAVVVDEYGGVAGLITLEDIFEEVFGEIRDETDREIDAIQRQDESSFIIDSSVMIDDILEKFDLELEHIGLDVAQFSTETVSFILTDTLERFPEVGEIIEFEIVKPNMTTPQVLEFHILDMTDVRIGKIEVKLHEKISEETGEEV